MRSLRSFPRPAVPALLCVLVFISQLLACSWPPSIVVVVPVVPPGSATISVLVSTEDKPAQEIPSLDVAAFVGQPYRFGIHPPLGATGNFAVAVAAFDRSGCLISTAASAIELGAADNDGFVYGRPEKTLQLTLDAGPADYATSCLSQRPSVRTFVQNEDDPTLAVITGWGFAPGVSVSLDGVPATSAVRKDGTRIEARFAMTPSPSGLRSAVLGVKNPDGSTTTKSVALYSIAFAPRDRNSYTLATNLEPVAIAIGDIDGDGLPDVVLAGLRNSTAGFVAVFRNQGAGRLPGLPAILELPDTMDDLQLADLDLDGKLDVVGISANASLLIVVLNDGQGNFTFNNTFPFSTPAGTAPRTVAVGNVMGNGDPEVIVASDANTSLPGLLLVYQSNASGISLAFGINCGFTLFGNVQIRDLDKDGRDDIAYVQTTTGAVATQLVSNLGIFLSDGAGNFAARPMLSTGAGAYAQVQAVDLDGDQLLDLVGSGVFTPTSQSGTAISVFANQGMANYPATRTSYTTLAQPFAMSVGDFNRDGRPDLVVSHLLKEGQGHVSTLLNLGAGQGFADVSLQPSYLLGYGDSNVAAADLNSDGKSDFAVVSRGYPKIKQPGQLQVFLNTTP